MNNDFTLRLPARIVFGPGKFNTLAGEAADLAGDGTVLAVLDPALRTALEPRLEKLLAGRKLVILAITPGEPTVEAADQLANEARRINPDLVIGIGGGSAMDTAKALAGLVTNPGGSEAYRGQELLKNPARPKIMVPTTAGTGSEVTPTAVLIGQGRKGGINSRHLIPETALLDPELTLSLPAEITGVTGLDALSHAVESYLSTRSNPFTEPLSLKAINLLAEHLPEAVANPNDLAARTAVLAGSLLAGITLANAGVIAGHSLSYPLGPRHNISHGIANGILLPHLVKALVPVAAEKLAALAQALKVAEPGDTRSEQQAQRAADFLFALERKIGFNKRLRDFGVAREDLDPMVKEAQQVAVPIANTPGEFTRVQLKEVYEAAW